MCKILTRRLEPRASTNCTLPYFAWCREPWCTASNIFFIIVPSIILALYGDTLVWICILLYCVVITCGICSGTHHAFHFPGSLLLDQAPIATAIILIWYFFGVEVFFKFNEWLSVWAVYASLTLLVVDHCQYLIRAVLEFMCLLHMPGPTPPSTFRELLYNNDGLWGHWGHVAWHTAMAFASCAYILDLNQYYLDHHQ